MNRTCRCIIIALAGLLLPAIAVAADEPSVSTRYKALVCPAPSTGSTWAILDRDGANRQVTPYLSSLGQGEAGTGVITSPPFKIRTDKITFTICGHDGHQPGSNKNLIALVDARKGQVLLKTPAPQKDAMQEGEWDVSGIRNWEVRIEVRDGHGGSGYAWMGVGHIDAGPEMRVDFSQGMPEGWGTSNRTRERSYTVLTGGVPFQRDDNTFTLVPKAGATEIDCGFAAERLFFLGCTVACAKVGQTYAKIEIHYAEGKPAVIPLVAGATLDGNHKLLSPARTLCLHRSTDPYQHYLVLAPRNGEVIKRIRLVAEPEAEYTPRITAVTCETRADSEQLMPLPKSEPSQREAAWIERHTISAGEPGSGLTIEQVLPAQRVEVADP